MSIQDTVSLYTESSITSGAIGTGCSCSNSHNGSTINLQGAVVNTDSPVVDIGSGVDGEGVGIKIQLCTDTFTVKLYAIIIGHIREQSDDITMLVLKRK